MTDSLSSVSIRRLTLRHIGTLLKVSIRIDYSFFYTSEEGISGISCVIGPASKKKNNRVHFLLFLRNGRVVYRTEQQYFGRRCTHERGEGTCDHIRMWFDLSGIGWKDGDSTNVGQVQQINSSFFGWTPCFLPLISCVHQPIQRIKIAS